MQPRQTGNPDVFTPEGTPNMRFEVQAQLDQMPSKEKKYLSYAPYPIMIQKLSNMLPQNERILGLASSMHCGLGENGILAYTPQRLVFGADPLGGDTVQWKVWKWQQIRGISPSHPFLGSVELVITTEDETVKFHVGQNKGDCKDWAGAMCREMASIVERAQFA
jgi:hypothetical protein